LVSLFVLIGVVLVVLYELNYLSMLVILSSSLLLLFYTKTQRPMLERREGKKTEGDAYPSLFSSAYLIFLVLVAYCLYLLIRARSGWVEGTVWDVVSPAFFVGYFLATFVLFGIILCCQTREASKLVLVVVYSVLSTSIFAVVLYPGNFGDPFYYMGFARMIVNYGSLRGPLGFGGTYLWSSYWLVSEKGLGLLTAIIAKMFLVDVYWVLTFITPVCWSIFIPFTAWKIAKVIGWGERTAIISAFLSGFYVGFVSWGSRSTANAFGFIPFLMSLCFSILYLKSGEKRAWGLSLVSVVVSGLMHPLTGMMSLVFFLLATSFRYYEIIKVRSLRKAHLFILVTFFGCVLAIPAALGLLNIMKLYLAPASISEVYAAKMVVTFDVEKLLKTDLWELVFGEYVYFSLGDLALRGFILFLGLVGLGWVFRKGITNKANGALVLFMFSVFLVCVIDYRVLQYAMVNVPFNASRIWTFGDFVVLPFAALAVNCIGGFLERWSLRKFQRLGWALRLQVSSILTLILIGLFLSVFATLSVYDSYERFWGVQPTELEVEAVEYLDSHTKGRYVVISMPHMAMVGYGFVGYGNPEKYYVYSVDLGQRPSVANMTHYMAKLEADVGYFVALSFRTPECDRGVSEASGIFSLFAILSNDKGEIYIFEYRVLPS